MMSNSATNAPQNGEQWGMGLPNPQDIDTTKDMKAPVRPVLKSLEIGQKAIFPIERMKVVSVCAYQLKIELSRIGWNFKFEKNLENFTYTITRTA